MKRVWIEAKAVPEGAVWKIELDGKPLRIPGAGTPLRMANPALAQAVAAEWHGAGDTLTMDDLPLTRLAGTAQDRIAPDPAPVAAAMAVYAQSDVLCYRAIHPAELASRQEARWQPWLDWAADRYGARLVPAEGIVHRPQHPEALARLAAAYAALSPDALAALGIAVPALGSAVLGLALQTGALTAEDAFAVAHLDELFQSEQWGEDAAATIRRRHVLADLALAERYLRLTGGTWAG